MNPGEHRQMAAVEDHHWWYRGLRGALFDTLASVGVPEHPSVLDAGCGTGANLRALEEAFAPSYLGGFDVSEEALEWARRKAPAADVYRSDLRRPEIRARPLDLVVSVDVLYIPGVEASFAGLLRLVDALAPGGLFVLHVPAYDWLYSRHDAAVHTAERYTATRVRRLMERLGLRVEVLTYRLCALFPLVVLRRLPSMLAGRRPDPRARSELHSPPGPMLNAALSSAVAVENRLITRGASLPWGSSVLAVGRRT